MDKLKTARGVTKIVTSLGAGTIVSQIIKNNVQTDSAYKKVTVAFGTIAISGMVAELASKHAGQKFDEFVIAYKQIDAQVKEQTKK